MNANRINKLLKNYQVI